MTEEKSGSKDSRSRPFSQKTGWWRRDYVFYAIVAIAACVTIYFGWFARWGDDFAKERGSVKQLTPRRAKEHRPRVAAGSKDARLTQVEIDRSHRIKTDAERAAEKFDPAQDDWNTEVLAEAAGKQLSRIARLIEQPQDIENDNLQELVANSFRCDRLRPASLTVVYHDDRITVRREKEGRRNDTALACIGTEALATALKDLVVPLKASRDTHVKFKQTSVDVSADGFKTTVLFEANARGPKTGTQQTATWQCQWSRPSQATGNRPRLMSINLKSFEEVQLDKEGGRLFVDSTQAVLGEIQSYHEQMLPGINHWLPRISRLLGMRFYGHQGLAVGDVNGDGLEDLYVCDAAGLPNRMYVQQQDGTLVDESVAAEVDWLEDTTSALLVDLDNDGDEDLVVATTLAVLVMENDGRGKFSLHGGMTDVIAPTSICAADYDADGDLDLYVCGYMRDPNMWQGGVAVPLPYHDAKNGGRNALMRNEGGFRFVNATRESGLDQDNNRFSFAAAWEDYDNDGDLDLYVANDFGRNNLYVNDDGRFKNIAATVGVEDVATGMSVSWGDCNRDGRMDLYVGNMFSSAGNRITSQPRFDRSGTEQAVAHVRRTARGNTLLLNRGDREFEDVSLAAAVNMGRWAWASSFVDINNDGWQDMVVANGYLTMEDSGDL